MRYTLSERTAASICLMLLLSSSSASASDILMAVMEDYRGEKTVHTQTTSGENCDAFLSELRKSQASLIKSGCNLLFKIRHSVAT